MGANASAIEYTNQYTSSVSQTISKHASENYENINNDNATNNDYAQNIISNMQQQIASIMSNNNDLAANAQFNVSADNRQTQINLNNYVQKQCNGINNLNAQQTCKMHVLQDITDKLNNKCEKNTPTNYILLAFIAFLVIGAGILFLKHRGKKLSATSNISHNANDGIDYSILVIVIICFLFVCVLFIPQNNETLTNNDVNNLKTTINEAFNIVNLLDSQPIDTHSVGTQLVRDKPLIDDFEIQSNVASPNYLQTFYSIPTLNNENIPQELAAYAVPDPFLDDYYKYI